MKAIVIAGGSIESPAFYKPLVSPEDLVLCADSGYQNAVKIGVTPHLVIGDFDSFPEESLPCQIERLRLPVEKDRTDLHECILYAIKKGAKEILLFGALGSRLDHSLASISLAYAGLSEGVKIRIINENNELFLFSDHAEIPKKDGYKLSLLPLFACAGIDGKGVYYPLENAIMEWGNPYGVSNEFTAEKAEISIKKGIMMAILSRD